MADDPLSARDQFLTAVADSPGVDWMSSDVFLVS